MLEIGPNLRDLILAGIGIVAFAWVMGSPLLGICDMDINKIARVIAESITYCADGSDFDIFIDGYDTDEAVMYGHDEDGNEYEIPFDEIDLELDSFFKYVKVDVDAV